MLGEHLQALGEQWGVVPLQAFDDRRIRDKIKKRRDVLAKSSERQADYWGTVLAIVLGYGVDSGLLAVCRTYDDRRLTD